MEITFKMTEEMLQEAFQKALNDLVIETNGMTLNECVEKQIPKKLKHGVCPNCSTNNDKIIKHLGNPQAHKNVYCWNCGQKLDWRV